MRKKRRRRRKLTSHKEASLMGTCMTVTSEAGLGKKPSFLLWHSMSCALKGSVDGEPGWVIQEAQSVTGPQSPKDPLLIVGHHYWALFTV